jgi:hypothetical protein
MVPVFRFPLGRCPAGLKGRSQPIQSAISSRSLGSQRLPILKGEKLAELPVSRSTVETSTDLRAAKALGVEIPIKTPAIEQVQSATLPTPHVQAIDTPQMFDAFNSWHRLRRS